ncbi:MAG: hypothetical protein GF334_01175 [Candidatus Altiarchaeales archaeon]|nr:hypothetical protein [Candidatus Altiarchaeales archaeon]
MSEDIWSAEEFAEAVGERLSEYIHYRWHIHLRTLQMTFRLYGQAIMSSRGPYLNILTTDFVRGFAVYEDAQRVLLHEYHINMPFDLFTRIADENRQLDLVDRTLDNVFYEFGAFLFDREEV